MALDEGDKAICAQIAGTIIEKVLKVHIDACPHGRSLRALICMSIGIAIGSGLASGSIVFMLARAIGGP